MKLLVASVSHIIVIGINLLREKMQPLDSAGVNKKSTTVHKSENAGSV